MKKKQRRRRKEERRIQNRKNMGRWSTQGRTKVKDLDQEERNKRSILRGDSDIITSPLTKK